MTSLKAFIVGIAAVADPKTLAFAQELITAFVRIVKVTKDDGTPVTDAELAAAWSEARQNFTTLRAEVLARQSTTAQY